MPAIAASRCSREFPCGNRLRVVHVGETFRVEECGMGHSYRLEMFVPKPAPTQPAETRRCGYNGCRAIPLKGKARCHHHRRFPLAAPTTLTFADARTLGSRIRALRIQRGWTCDHLAGRAGVSGTAIGMWERDDVALRGSHLACVARALGVSIQLLVEGRE